MNKLSTIARKLAAESGADRTKGISPFRLAIPVAERLTGQTCGDGDPKEFIEKYLISILRGMRAIPFTKKRKKKKLYIQGFIERSKVDPLLDSFLISFEWRALRMMAIKKYGNTCQCCGASPKTGAVINVDHIKPRKLFPQLALDLSNLQILCHVCNHGKGNWDTTDWRN